MVALLAIIPIFALIALGFLLRYLNILKKSWTLVLSKFVYYVSLPALIVYSFTNFSISDPGISTVIYANISALFIGTIITLLFVLLMPVSKKIKASILLASTLGNSVYLGIPVVNNVLYDSIKSENNSLITAIGVVHLVIGLLIALVAIEFFLLGTKNIKFIIKHILKNPLFLSSIVGIIISIIGGWPEWTESIIVTPLRMLADTASPIALVALGSFLFGHKMKSVKLWQIAFATSVKLLVLPIIVWTVLGAFGVAQENINISVLMSAMPVAVTVFVLSEIYKFNTQFAVMTLISSTILSILSIPIIATIL